MTPYPYVKVDFQHRMLSVMLNDRKIAGTDQLDDAHLVDLDADGRVVGIDILAPDDLRIEEIAERFGFRDQVPTIRAAIQRAMTPTAAWGGEPMVIQAVSVPGPPAAGKTEAQPPVLPPLEVTTP